MKGSRKAQTSRKKKRRLPKDLKALSDHDLMERIVGKRAMKAIDKLVAEHPTKPTSSSI